MSESCESPAPQLCGCCDGISSETPELVTNRAGLDAIAYRVGTHATFKASLLARLSASDEPGLVPLRTRDDSDFSIALLDAWATSLDILTFYQERLANESYLRTAINSSSVFSLAQLVGYQPSPGVAASAFLAFTLSSAPGSPDPVLIPAATRVQSVPGPGQSPQVFETSSDLKAWIELNAIPPQKTLAWRLNPGDRSVWLQGTSNNINVGDVILFVNKGLHAEAVSGITSGSAHADLHYVTSVTVDSNLGNTLIEWDKPLKWTTANDNTAYLYVFRKKAALFGVQAPDPRVFSTEKTNLANLSGFPNGGNGDWSFQYAGKGRINLDASYAGLAPAQGGEPQWTLLVAPNVCTAAFQITNAAETGPLLYTLTSKTTQLTLAHGQILANHILATKWDILKNALNAYADALKTLVLDRSDPIQFLADSIAEQLAWVVVDQATKSFLQVGGSGKPEWDSFQDALTSYEDLLILWASSQAPGLPSFIVSFWESQKAAAWAALEAPVADLEGSGQPISDDVALSAIVSQTRNVTAFVQSQLLSSAGPPYLRPWSHDKAYARQSGLLVPVEGARLGIQSAQQFGAGQPVAVMGQRLRLRASTAGKTADSKAGFTPVGSAASLAISEGQIFLIDAFPPQAAPGGKDELWSVITTDGVAGTLEINHSNLVLIPADSGDPVVGEIAAVSQTSVTGSITSLHFTGPLARIYDRSTLTVNANVVAATQGETMNEILGSGDAANSALDFTLKQSPLTYVSSPLSMGAQSTLQIWVNNLQWHEVDNFLDSGPADRVFVTQTDQTGKATVQFGNGQEGARTPTGQMNIRAVYRKGIGSAGNVLAGQLSQPLDRPQGLKGVTNPDPATGGADPDTADEARATAPLHVLTLDRVVSLEDYQNYALAFAGIAKVLATWTWFGRTRGVFLTVAGAGGSVFKSGDPTIVHLGAALRDASSPFVPLRVASYRPVLFEVGANVRVDKVNYDSTRVLAQVWQSLSTNLGFGPMQLGRGVAQSEVIALIQQTPGVIAVELTKFNRRGQPPRFRYVCGQVLRAASAVPAETGTPKAAELLLLDPASRGSLEVWS
jgi:hypothetical protein